MEALSLIDVAAEDDFLLDLASPPQHPDPPPRAAPGERPSISTGIRTSVTRADLELPDGGSQTAAAGKVLDPTGATEPVPERTESPKKRKPKGGANLRKSLAWDKAFFTGEGVLDTEELGIVNSTFRKTQGSRLLPGIVEEMRRSNESTTSTLESESFVLESLDTELFDNVRASIQRTLGKPDKAPAVTAASSKNPRATAKAPPVTARKGVDRMPQTQSKIRPPVSTSNAGVGNKQRPQVTPKEPPVARVAVSRAAEAKPSSRPPRALPRVATMGAPANTAAISGISDKRSSTGGVANRQAVGKSANTSASMSSRPSGVSKTSSTSKSGVLSSAAIPSSHSAPMGTMAGAKTKSPTLIGKSRAQRIPLRSSSRSDISNVDPARASRSKIPTRGHGESASPIISPSSSVDSMSSVISGASTASTIGRASHTSESFSTRSSSVSPSTRKSNDHHPTTRPLTVTEGGTPCDNLKSNADTSTQGNGFKPSGLRRPTPKIGYFDAEKSVEQKAPRTQLQSTKVLFSPLATLATPNPRISSTPKANFEFSTSDQEELKSMAAAVCQTKVSPSLLLRVAQTEVKPSKVPEHEASQIKGSTSLPHRVAEFEVESSKVIEHEASHTEPLPSLPLRVAQNEVDSSKVPEHQASQTEALPSGPLGVAQTEVEPSKVREHEASQTKESPSLLLRVTQTEVEPSEVTEHEASQTEDEPSRVTDQAASQTEASLLLPLRVAQNEADSSKMSEGEAHMLETGPLVAVDIAEESTPALHQNIQANVDDSPSTVKLSSCTIDLQESETMAAPGEESSPTQTNVAQTEEEPSKVMEHESSKESLSLPLRVAQTEVEPSKVMDHEASETKESPSAPLRVAQTEEEPSKVTEHETSQTKESPSLPLIVAQGEVEPTMAMEYEATQPEASPSLPLRVAQTEVEPSKVTEQEATQPEASPSLPLRVAQTELEPSKVSEHEACILETGPLVAMDIAEESIPASHQVIQANGDASPSTVNLSSCTIDQQESETMAALGEENSPSKTEVAQMEVEPSNVIEHEASPTKASPSLPLGVAKMEKEPSEVIDHEACMPQVCSVSVAVDNAKENIQPSGAPSPLKENILASHQNIQDKVATTPVKGNILASHPNVQAIGDMTPVTLLTQKLSSISLGPANGEATPLTQKLSSVSLGPANGEATPLTLLAQKLSSISLGDATD